jgi:hypothetical protein
MNTDFGTEANEENEGGGEIPSTNIQAPEKHQGPSNNRRSR